MADNLALKLLVAGIVGAVIGAAAAERYHFPTGLVYGGLNQSPVYRTRPPIDPMYGSGRVEREDGAVIYEPEWRELPPPPRYYRPPLRGPARRTAWCWREYEDWNFRTRGHYVRCSPGSASRVYRPRSG